MLERHTKWSHAILTMVACTILSSCTTSALWKATNPKEFVVVAKNKTNEDELKARGLSYWTDPQRDLFYVEKTKLQKIGDYTIRTIGTPVTVAIDAATTIAVVGTAVFVLAYCSDHGDAQAMATSAAAARRDREEKEMESVRELLDTVRREEKERPSTTPHGTGFVRP